MEKTYKSLFFLVLFFLLQINVGFSQNNINPIEDPIKAKKITDEIPDGKALLVFETEEKFSFESSMENLVQPSKEGKLYKLFVNTGSVVIAIKWGPAVTKYLNFGQLNEKSDPPLKSKNIKYYKLELSNILEWGDQTMKMSKEVVNTQATFEKEALIIINVYPDDLAVKFECDSGINPSKIDSDGGKYKVYILPQTKTLSIKATNYDPAVITFDSLQVKAVRYYFVQVPPTAKESEQADVNIKVGNFSIESTPPGATIQMIGNPPFNQQQNRTPFALQGFKEGTEIITLSLNRYENVTDTITINKKKGKKAVYRLIPKFAFISCNINPPFPVSELFVDGSKVNSIVNDSLIELPKGTRKLEIRAPHFYPVTKIVNLAAGETSEINIKLSPIMGTFSISPGTYAENADVYINDLKIGLLPINNFPLQEGNYKLVLKKKGFDMKKRETTFQVQENELTNMKNIEMVNLKEVTIESSPSGANVIIDNKSIGRTPVDVNIGIGQHNISVSKENYENTESMFDVDIDKNSYTFQLKPKLFLLSIKTYSSIVDPFTTYIDGTLGSTQNLPPKKYSIVFRNTKTNKVVYKTSYNHPTKTDKAICIPSKFGLSILNVNYFYPFSQSDDSVTTLKPHFSYDIGAFSLYGFTITLCQIEGFSSSIFPDKPILISPITNIEFKFGGNVTRWFDISLFGNYYYQTTFTKKEAGKEKTDAQVNSYSYGASMSFYFWKGIVGLTLKSGFKNSNVKYEIFNGEVSQRSSSFSENGPFISFGINFISPTLDGKILRIWKRPLSQIGAY